MTVNNETYEKKQRAKELAQLYKKRPAPMVLPKRKPRRKKGAKRNG